MLLKRLLTTVILGPLVIVGVLTSNHDQFAGAVIVILIIALWEFCSLIKVKSITGKAAFILLAIATTYTLQNEPSALMPVLIPRRFGGLLHYIGFLVFQNIATI